jgi:hypothetical protein
MNTTDDPFASAVLELLEETFESVHGYVLDGGTSLFETLADVTSEEASVPVGGRCATLAAQVSHVAFFLDVAVGSARDPNFPRADWGHIWNTVGAVNDPEWDAIRAKLRASYDDVRALVRETPGWDRERYAGAIAIVAHSTYHLGEIRQALCTIRP